MEYLENRDLYFDTREPNATINPRQIGATDINVKNTSMPKSCLDNTVNKNVWKRWNPEILDMLNYLRGINIRQPPDTLYLPDSGLIYYGGYGVIYPNGGWVSIEIDREFNLSVKGGSWPNALIIEGNSTGTDIKGYIGHSSYASCPVPNIDDYVIGPIEESDKQAQQYWGRWGHGITYTYRHRSLVSGVKLMVCNQWFDSWGKVTFANGSNSPFSKKSTFNKKPTSGKHTWSRGGGKVHTPTTVWWHYAVVGDVRR